jgi:hypothetical protein
MKLNKFVGKKNLKLNNNDIMLCIDKLQGTKLTFDDSLESDSRIYTQKLGDIKIKGIRNHWLTSYTDKHFQSVAKNIMCFIDKKEGVIETEKPFVYVEGSEGTICYSINLKIKGDFRYKYQRGWSNDSEIFCYYDYDSNLGELLERLRGYYDNFFKYNCK